MIGAWAGLCCWGPPKKDDEELAGEGWGKLVGAGAGTAAGGWMYGSPPLP